MNKANSLKPEETQELNIVKLKLEEYVEVAKNKNVLK